MADKDKGEFFDLAEVKLNRQAQHWGNLGFWQYDNHYSDACQQLAIELAQFAQLEKQQTVFDAGFGCGDQILVWYKGFEVRHVVGINLSVSQTKAARRKLSAAGYLQQSDIQQGDIHRIERPGKAGQFDHVLALDCIYHFPNKVLFFRQAEDLLASGGRLTFSDLVVDVDARKNWRFPLVLLMCALSKIPAANMKDRPQLRKILQDQGYQNIEFQDISAEVMMGFAKWYFGAHGPERNKLTLAQRLKYNITARFLNWAYRNNLLSYRLIRADKP